MVRFSVYMSTKNAMTTGDVLVSYISNSLVRLTGTMTDTQRTTIVAWYIFRFRCSANVVGEYTSCTSMFLSYAKITESWRYSNTANDTKHVKATVLEYTPCDDINLASEHAPSIRHSINGAMPKLNTHVVMSATTPSTYNGFRIDGHGLAIPDLVRFTTRLYLRDAR